MLNFAQICKTSWINERAFSINHVKFLQVTWPEFQIRTNRRQNVPKDNWLLRPRAKNSWILANYSCSWTKAPALYPWRNKLQPKNRRNCLAKGNVRQRGNSRFSEMSSRKTSCGLGIALRSWDLNTRRISRWANNRSTSGGGIKQGRDLRRLFLRILTATKRIRILSFQSSRVTTFLSHSKMNLVVIPAD